METIVSSLTTFSQGYCSWLIIITTLLLMNLVNGDSIAYAIFLAMKYTFSVNILVNSEGNNHDLSYPFGFGRCAECHFFGFRCKNIFPPLFERPQPPPPSWMEIAFNTLHPSFLQASSDRIIEKDNDKHPSRSPDWQCLLGTFLFGARYPAWWSDAERQDDWRPRIGVKTRFRRMKSKIWS